VVTDPNVEVRRLIESRPKSHRTGTFPRDYLPPNEAVVYETRPYFWDFVAPNFYRGIGLFILAGFWWFAGSIFNEGLSSDLAALNSLWSYVLAALGVVVVIQGILDWYYTSYACTNRRIILKRGIFGRVVIDARFEKIQCVTLTESSGSRIGGFGTLLFSLSLGSSYSAFSGIRHGGILWRSVPDPLALRLFVEDVAETFARMDREGLTVILEED
jgi:hypothetical protein